MTTRTHALNKELIPLMGTTITFLSQTDTVYVTLYVQSFHFHLSEIKSQYGHVPFTMVHIITCSLCACMLWDTHTHTNIYTYTKSVCVSQYLQAGSDKPSTGIQANHKRGGFPRASQSSCLEHTIVRHPMAASARAPHFLMATGQKLFSWQ